MHPPHPPPMIYARDYVEYFKSEELEDGNGGKYTCRLKTFVTFKINKVFMFKIILVINK